MDTANIQSHQEDDSGSTGKLDDRRPNELNIGDTNDTMSNNLDTGSSDDRRIAKSHRAQGSSRPENLASVEENENIARSETTRTLKRTLELLNTTQSPENDETGVDDDGDERRRVRLKYRSLLNDLDDHKLDWSQPQDEKELLHALEKSHELYKSVKSTQESALDSKFLVQSVDLIAARSRAIKIGEMQVDVNRFLERVFMFLGGNRRHQRPDEDSRDERGVVSQSDASAGGAIDEDSDAANAESRNELAWEELGRVSWQFSRRAPTVSFLYGPIDAPTSEKPRREISGLRNEPIASLTRPIQAQFTNDDAANLFNVTTHNVIRIHKILVQNGLVSMMRLIINPFSFSQSVENMFFLSFLVSDGKARVKMTSDQRDPIVEPISNFADAAHENAPKSQCVFSLTMADWKVLLDK